MKTRILFMWVFSNFKLVSNWVLTLLALNFVGLYEDWLEDEWNLWLFRTLIKTITEFYNSKNALQSCQVLSNLELD